MVGGGAAGGGTGPVVNQQQAQAYNLAVLKRIDPEVEEVSRPLWSADHSSTSLPPL